MKTKEKIIEALEGKRTEQIWELIEKSYLEVFEDAKKEDLEIARVEYLEFENDINNESNRFVMVEHYNLGSDFYCRYYEDGRETIEEMFEDYFSGSDGGWEEILLIDMQEKKCYLVNKEVKYIKQEIEIQ